MAKAKMAQAGMVANPFSGRKMGPKVLESIQLKRSMDGGFQATHQHTNYDHPPEHHQFPKNGGKGLLEHIVKHMGIEMAEEKKGKEGKAVKAEKAEAAQQEGET